MSRHDTLARTLALVLLALLVTLVPHVHAVKFALAGVALVVVTANVAPNPSTAPNEQRIDIEIVDASSARHVYQAKRNLTGEVRFAITTHSDDDVGVCLKNYLDYSVPNAQANSKSRVVDLDVDIGADALIMLTMAATASNSAIANKESLSVLETEMRKIEGIVREINEEMEYLRRRETRFADTNDSTNRRVAYFGWFTIFAMVGLGAWQLSHLHSFFKRKYLID
ncbi:emp24/gp25L/p24 family/GOLD-domain-containing protein [Auriculariales sp. MPI-PUGE-AT-0066]|nr:emp24/gp25L/p24 family/GOLD-domain-containing protein [Auriculariales sp. MPI-PUGE-AT-0066]